MKRSELRIGEIVSVVPRRNRNTIVKGKLVEILTSAEEHPHGILVKLDDGTIGRVSNRKTTTNREKSESSANVRLSMEDLMKGEGQFIEYKSSALWSQNLTKQAINDSKSSEVRLCGTSASKFILAKEIAGFLNSKGGYLIVGIKENKAHQVDQVIGINSELKKLKDCNEDGYKRMILDHVIRKYLPSKIFNHVSDFIDINFPFHQGERLCVIKVERSPSQVFVTHKSHKFFYVRTDSETRPLEQEELVEYCSRHF